MNLSDLTPVFESFYMVAVAIGFCIFLWQLPILAREFILGRKKNLFECKMCGNCCRFKIIDVKKSDKLRLKAAGLEDYVDKSGKKMKVVNGKCVGLKNDSCTIHEFRPDVCREFPFYKLYGKWMCQKIYFCPALDELKKK